MDVKFPFLVYLSICGLVEVRNCWIGKLFNSKSIVRVNLCLLVCVLVFKNFLQLSKFALLKLAIAGSCSERPDSQERILQRERSVFTVDSVSQHHHDDGYRRPLIELVIGVAHKFAVPSIDQSNCQPNCVSGRRSCQEGSSVSTSDRLGWKWPFEHLLHLNRSTFQFEIRRLFSSILVRQFEIFFR